MKKLTLIITLLFIVSLFTACGTQNTADDTETTETTVETTAEITEEQNVEIELSKDALSDPESVLNDMKAYGAEVEENDNLYVFVFSKAEHQKLLDDKYAETTKKFKDYEDDETHYIDTIEYDEDFRNLVFKVNRDLYDASTNSMNNIVIAATALSYQMYLGTGQKTNVKVIYSETEEVISIFTLPMNLTTEQ